MYRPPPNQKKVTKMSNKGEQKLKDLIKTLSQSAYETDIDTCIQAEVDILALFKSRPTQPQAVTQGFRDQYESDQKEIERLKTRLSNLDGVNQGEVWYWDSSINNNLGSVVCPVLISADDLRSLVKPQAVTQGEDDFEKKRRTWIKIGEIESVLCHFCDSRGIPQLSGDELDKYRALASRPVDTAQSEGIDLLSLSVGLKKAFKENARKALNIKVEDDPSLYDFGFMELDRDFIIAEYFGSIGSVLVTAQSEGKENEGLRAKLRKFVYDAYDGDKPYEPFETLSIFDVEGFCDSIQPAPITAGEVEEICYQTGNDPGESFMTASLIADRIKARLGEGTE